MPFNRKSNRAIASVPPSMAPSLSSLLSRTFPFPTPDLRCLSRRNTFPPPPITVAFSTISTQSDNLTSTTTLPPPPERRSFAVATGEFFLGIASRLLKTSNKVFSQNSASIPVLELPRKKGRKVWGDRGNAKYDPERIGVVLEDENQPNVIWEQRVKDVEAEKERKVVTSPGFSFSAAGLLFPYHLGAAQFLIEKGYIKVRVLIEILKG